jgi:hypothetical protein
MGAIPTFTLVPVGLARSNKMKCLRERGIQLDRDPLLETIIRALKPMPYWIGYKHQKYWGHRLPEVAMVAELRETLFGAVDRTQSVRCEVSYTELGLKAARRTQNTRKRVGRPEQADLVIFDKKERPIAVIEVKRGHSIDTAGRIDLDYLHSLREGSQGQLRTFFVLLSEAKKPKTLISRSGTANRKFKIDNFPGRLAVRRVLRAVGHASKPTEQAPNRVSDRSKSQHWAALMEVF